MPDYKGKLDGSVEEQAKLREEGLAAIVNPGDGPDLTKVLDAEDTRFLKAIYANQTAIAKKLEELSRRIGGAR